MGYLSIFIAGFGGGVVRGLVGFLKYQYSYKSTGFDLRYFFGMAFLFGVVGLLVSFSVSQTDLEFLGGSFTPAIAFVTAYAGGDFLNSIYKIIVKRPEK